MIRRFNLDVWCFILVVAALIAIVFIAVWGMAARAQEPVGALSEGGPVGPGGVEVTCDLPVELRKKNINSKGLGCCVFRSMDHASRWQQVPQLFGLPEQMAKAGIAGGGDPPKVDQMMKRFAPGVEYLQHTGGDIEFLYAALKTVRMICVTYNGHDMHYGQNTSIAHMVNCVYIGPPTANPRLACILDNNFVGPNQLVWMTVGDFAQRWKGGGGWAVVLLNAPPPPPVKLPGK